MNGKIKKLLLSVGGLFIGVINGAFGGGGGMLCVPLLKNVGKTEEKKSHATSIPIILPTSIASAVVYIKNGCFEWGFLYVTGGVVVGGIVGALLLKKLPTFYVGLLFGIITVAMGIKTFF